MKLMFSFLKLNVSKTIGEWIERLYKSHETDISVIKLIIHTGGWLKLQSKFQDGENDGYEASCYTVQ